MATLVHEYEDIFDEWGGATPFAEHTIDADTLREPKQTIEHEQDRSKTTKDETRRVGEDYSPGDLILLRSLAPFLRLRII